MNRSKIGSRGGQDRKHEIEAAIVRIMKARKNLAHGSLVAEVIEQLRHRFALGLIAIEKRIAGLIDREYLSRTPENRSLRVVWECPEKKDSTTSSVITRDILMLLRIAEETERAKHYLDNSSEGPILRVLDEELVIKHMTTVVSLPNGGVVFMVENHKYDEMACMFKLFNRVPDGMKTMLAHISEYLSNQGKDLVTEDENAPKNPVQFVTSLLSLKDEYDKFLEKSFGGDRRFKTMISSAFERFLNLNQRSPEYLSLFIDDKLKKGNKDVSEQELEAVLDRAMVLFGFLQEKDVFERYYWQHLTKRLLFNRSKSDDSENTMIAKLKQKCENKFTSKLKEMLKDITLSKKSNDEFEDFWRIKIMMSGFWATLKKLTNGVIAKFGFELSVSVLTTEFWPMATCLVDVALPRLAQAAFVEFKKFYLNNRSGGQLSLQPNLGTADLEAQFFVPPIMDDSQPSTSAAAPKSAARKHILTVSTYQMCVIMLFNEQREWTVHEMIAATKIPEKDLKRTLLSISTGKQKILQRQDGTSGEIADNSSFIVNDSFSSRDHRIKLQAGSGKNEQDRVEKLAKVDEDRKHEIEAAIVRIMKARKKLAHGSLVAEVIEQLRHRFTPSRLAIKKRIEGLIDREYLSRTPENRSLYQYIA